MLRPGIVSASAHAQAMLEPKEQHTCARIADDDVMLKGRQPQDGWARMHMCVHGQMLAYSFDSIADNTVFETPTTVYADLLQTRPGPLEHHAWLLSGLCLPWLLSQLGELALSAGAHQWAAQHALLPQHAARSEPAHLR